VVSKAAEQLSTEVAGEIAAVVLFGNPNGEDSVPNVDDASLEIFCSAGDLICAGQSIILPPHLAYGSDTNEAADFVASKVNV
jgi:cutinase